MADKVLDDLLNKMLLNPDPTDGKDKEAEADLVAEEYSQEYDFLDTALDNIDSCLTALEQQNDDLYLQLEDLLRSNRENSQEILGQVGAEARHSVTVQEGAAAEVAVKPSTSESSDSKNPSEATESQTTQNLKPETSKSPDQPSE